MLTAMTARDWVSRLAAARDEPEGAHDLSLRTREGLVSLLGNRSEWDVLRRLGLILLAFPEADVTRRRLAWRLRVRRLAPNELADVNGLAGSIELYLGRDVLTGEDGSLQPAQWKSFMAAMGRYHGEVTGKYGIHKAFRAKAAAALSNDADASRQDWEGLRLILKAILTAFQQPGPPRKRLANRGQSVPVATSRAAQSRPLLPRVACGCQGRSRLRR
jgi:hypothetical protein